MFRPGRLFTYAILGAIVYFGFFAVPAGPRSSDAFDPDLMATHELAAWKAEHEKAVYGLFTSLAQFKREQNRYPWYKAGLAGFDLSRATTEYAEMRGRYERVLPDLTSVAAMEKAWFNAEFDPAEVARAQLTWWVQRRIPNLNGPDQVGEMMSQEYSLRYGVPPDRVIGAAILRAQAMALRDEGAGNPNWPVVLRMLKDSYKALKAGVKH
jgi:hypothetical protein